MIAVGHTSLGVVSGAIVVTVLPQTINLPVAISIAFITGLISHYLADLIPHGHYDFRPRHPTFKSLTLLGVDVILPILFFGWLVYSALGLNGEVWILVAAVAGALIPDSLDVLVRLAALPNWQIFAWHQRFHRQLHWHNQATSPFPHGARLLSLIDLDLIPMVVVAALAVVWLV